MSQPDSLVGERVVHTQYGPGVIVEDSGDRVKAHMGVRVPEARTMIHSYVQEMYPELDVTLSREVVMEGDNWNGMATKTEIHRAIVSISGMDIPIVIPTSNPPRPASVKAKLIGRMREMGNGGVEQGPLNLATSLATAVDLQLSWYLLQGKEPVPVYHRRILGIEELLGKDAWWRVINAALDYPELGASWTYMASLSALLSVSDESDIDTCVDLLRSAVEKRLESHSGIVKGYTRYMS